ncbi:MAG: two-component regulator propeller domain-containing protein [Bacteroidota bacterium]
MIRLFILLPLCFLLTCSLVGAQTNNKAFAFNALTINDGLSQGMIIRMLQDKNGFMWFATLDGLNRYDGYQFVVYRHNPNDKTSITESYAQALFQDSKGRLWIGTVSGGLDLFDSETETFIHLKHREGDASSLSPGSIKAIAEDKQGNIWVHVHDKLEKITIHKKSNTSQETFSIEHVKVPFNYSTSIFSITSTGNIYFANAKDGVLYRLNDTVRENWSVVYKVEDYPELQNKSNNPFFRIVLLLEDTARAKFYVFHDGGILVVNDKTGLPEKIHEGSFFRNHDLPFQASLDKNGLIWFPSGNKLSFFNIHTGTISYAKGISSNHTRTLNSAYSTFIDRSGLLWIGTSGYGILKRNNRSENFNHTGNSSSYSINEADDGKILIGNNVVVREVFDRSTRRLMPAAPKFNTKEYKQVLFSSVAVDKRGKWFAYGDTLRCYNDNLKKSWFYPLPVTHNHEYDELIQCRIQDGDGNIWLGTTGGLLRFSLADLKWSIYQNKPNDSSSLSSNVVFSLCLDPLQPKKYLWVGTRGGGLNRLDLNTGRSKVYTIKDGLPNNVVYGILKDEDGNIWMSTNKGLSCYNPVKNIFRNFDYKDGLQSNEFNRGAYCRTKDGTLFFGGVNGFNYFYPAEILSNTKVPQIIITGFKLNNQSVAVTTENSPLTKAIYLTKQLTLPYKQNFVSFEFASMDFTDPEKNLYHYKLQGFDEDWINSGTTHNATYTNLDPGTYTFTVKGSNSDGIWNEEGTSLQLIILPPWYLTWWFQIAIGIAVLLAGYFFYRYRLAQALQLQFIRNRIANDLHDEVGSNLSNIYIFSNVAQQKAGANNETAPLLQKISDYTQQSMDAMNDIVWMINSRNDRFENIMVRMRTLSAEFAETCDCELHLHFDENLNDVKLNMEERKNFYLIYKEAINNTAKYAACKNLWVEMKLHQNTVTLKIIDDGKGFDVTNAKTGNGIFNMKKRAEMLGGILTIKSVVAEGTTYQLSFKV